MTVKKAIAVRDVVRGKFWLNLAIVLIATSWIPLVSMSVTNPADGTVQEHLVPVYRCYGALFVEPSLIAVVAVGIHLVMCFAISYAVQRMFLRAGRES